MRREMTEEREKRRLRLLLFALVFALIFARFCAYGFKYWYQLDDYIQYHNYTAAGGPVWDVVRKLGLLAARPLAGLADVYFWQRFFPVMLLGAALVAVMYAASACLFREVFFRRFGTGYFFLAVYALLPLGMEGTYWMSASTRIVTGLFFASLALWAFDVWLRDGRRGFAAAYCVCQLLSYGFYEQLIPFSAASVILLAALDIKKYGRRTGLALWSFAAAGIYFAFVGVFHESALYGAKTGFILPTSDYYFSTFLPEVLSQLKSAFLGGGFYTLTRGFVRGAGLIFSDGRYIYAVVYILLCAAFFLLAKGERASEAKRPVAALVIGILLALAPTAPFFAAETTWFSLRGTVCSFCGIALVADTVLRLIFGNLKSGMAVIAVISAAFSMWCGVCAVSEMHDYRATCEKDMQVCTAISETLTADGNTAAELKIGILNLSPSYLPEQNCFYHEHIHGVTESDWALTGALRYYAENQHVPSVTPVPAGRMYARWNREAMLLSGFDALYLYDGESSLSRVFASEQSDGRSIITDGKSVLAFAWEEDGNGYLEIISDTDAISAPS